MLELPAEALDSRLKLRDDLQWRGDGAAQGGDDGRLGGRDVVVELLDEADDLVGAFQVKLVELLA